MSNELRWGGINGKSLCKAVLSDLWMVFAVMVITYLGLGLAGSLKDKPLYTSSTVVAVYPFNQMYTPENSSSALETVGAVNEVFNSEMFRMGLEERLAESEDYSLHSRQISRTFILMLSVSSTSPEKAYQILRTALDYFGEISSHLAGESQLEILTEPDFPTSPSNDSKIKKYQTLLTLFMGFAMMGFLVLIYAVRKTYKSVSAIRHYYQNVRFFRIPASENSRRNKKKSSSEAMRKTALELLQMLRSKHSNSIFVTSAAPDEGKTEVIASLAREMAGFDKFVVILETESGNSAISEYLADVPDQYVRVIPADGIIDQDYDRHIVDKVESILKKTEKIADVVFIEGCIWTGSRDELSWKNAAETSLAVCRQDKADFYAIDRMMTDLQENNPGFLGCVLNGF